MRPVRSTLVRPTAATYTSLATAAENTLRWPAIRRARCADCSGSHSCWACSRLVFVVLLGGTRRSRSRPAARSCSSSRAPYVEGAEPPILARLGRLAGTLPSSALLSELAKAERDDRLGHDRPAHPRPRHRLGQGAGAARRDPARRARAAIRSRSSSSSRSARTSSTTSRARPTRSTSRPARARPLVGLAAEHFFLGGCSRSSASQFEVERIGRSRARSRRSPAAR